MEARSKIAVLVPTYKPREYIRRCFLSIERQTLNKSDFCVYVALNGPRLSYERYVLEVLKQFSFKYSYIYIEKAGVSNARNSLITSSVEPYITFVDDDDMLSDNFLESLLEVSSESYLGIANVYNFDESSENLKQSYIGKSFEKLNYYETSKIKARKYFSSPCSKLIHRDIIGPVRFDGRLAKGEDALFMAQISPKIMGVMKTDPSACYYVYERPGSASRRNVKASKEVVRLSYLLLCYFKMLAFGGYDRVFILTRFFATLKQFKKLWPFGF